MTTVQHGKVVHADIPAVNGVVLTETFTTASLSLLVTTVQHGKVVHADSQAVNDVVNGVVLGALQPPPSVFS